MLRSYFIKGIYNIFLYRVLNFFNRRRDNHYRIMIFVNRLEILLRRLRASWMDAMSAPKLNQEFYDNLADHNRIGNDRACAVHTHSITE